eukprot:TRINITY_DN34142_c0_g1_i1.p3 TRINITY_DN34142_c0_g1~~TRINITY_DN34142_c0_g1_i1.p3  ORF type:complete len:123 (-),score=19.17 TRINITY_DN34142_c0_g1_i1:10-378(-)
MNLQALTQQKPVPRSWQHQKRQITLAAVSMEEESRQGYKLKPSEDVLKIWKSAKAVCFDVDSSLCTDESIDEIAAFLGVGDVVKELTAKAMGGSVKFQDALAMRLNAMKPSLADIERGEKQS